MGRAGQNPLWAQCEAVTQRRASAPAVLHGTRTLSFSELHERARARAATLGGVAPGERVILAADNSADLLIWAAALWHRGAIPVLVHADAPASQLAYFATKVAPALIVTNRDTGWPAGLRYLRPDAPSDIGTDPAPPLPPAPCAVTDVGSIVFTSGSSGMPKGVMQSAATLTDGAARVGAYLGYGPDDRILCPVPFAFDYGWGQALSCLLQGQTLVLPERPGGFGICAALTDHAPTVLAGVPAVFADLCAGLAPIQDTQRASIRLITNTGSKMPPRVWDRLCAMFPDAAISLNYGLTETYRSAALPVPLARAYPDAVGHAIPGVTLFVVADDGTLAPQGTHGEVVHRGAGTFLGYWDDPEATARVRRPDPAGSDDHVVFTGDLGVIGPDGLLRLEGRRDRQMKSMGVRVSPDEVEAILDASGLVADVGIIALADEMIGHLIVACVVPAPTLAGETDPKKALIRSLTIFARENMSPYMRPRRWEIFNALPRTRSAKVDYPALKRAVEARG